MFAAVKVLFALVIACGSVIVAILESTHPTLIACCGMAFAVGAIVGELARVRRRRTVRSLAR